MFQSIASPRVNLALKITNWCNLCCAHCMERSHNLEPFNLMPIETVERYVVQYKNMGIPIWDYIVFTGGESMAPYFCGQHKYIPTVAEICAKNDLSPCFKTNAKWSAGYATHILKDLSDIAHKYDRQISLDISIDEYHNNLFAAANVINIVMSNQKLIDAIVISFVGLNTAASQYKFQEFTNLLKQRGMFVGPIDADGMILVSKGNKTNVMFYDFGGLTRAGRVADNNLENARPISGLAHNGNVDCLEITNNGTAILNYRHTTATKDKTLKQIYNELTQNKR